MRRILALLLAVALASEASAKVLVIAHKQTNTDPIADPASWFGKQDQNYYVPSVLTALGVDFDVIGASNSALKTEYCRTGTFVYEGGRTVTYDAIIHTGMYGPSSGRGYRPDSLTLIGASATQKYVRVPQIMMGYNGGSLSEAAACSTLSSHYDLTSLTNTGQTNYAPTMPTVTYQGGIAKNAALTVGAYLWPGGVRVLMRAGIGAGWVEGSGYSPRTWPDSLWKRIGTQSPSAAAAEDSFVVMAKKLDNIPSCNGAAYIIINDHDNCENYRDPVPFLAALAYADSLAGGGVLGSAKKSPLKLAFQIRGAFSRGTQLGVPTSTGGMTETDSTNFIATIDSIAALGVPVTVGVNIDSLGFYANYDKRWWSRVPLAKYAVHQTTGTTDTTNVSGVGGAASFQMPRDPLGRYRRRIAVGMSDWSDTSSIATLVRGCFWKLDSTFGASKVDRIVIAHGDDWSPVNGAALGRDSVIYAMSMGGARGLTVNPVASITRGVGFDAYSSRDPLLYAPSRGPFKLLVTEGVADSGSVPWDNFISSGGYCKRFYFTERQWRGALQSINRGMYLTAASLYANDVATQQGTEGLKFMGTARIISIHCADLQSGLRSDAATIPLRPGWKTIKNMVNGARIINSFGYQGRKLIVFTYPEDIEP